MWKPFPVLNHVSNSIQLNFNLHLASTPTPPNGEVYKCFLDSLMSYEIKGQKTLQRRWTGVGAAGGVAGDTLVLALIAVSDRLLLSGRPSCCLGTVSRCCLSEVMSFWDLESSKKEIQGRQVGAQSFAETFLQDICTPSSGAQGRVLDIPLDVGPRQRTGGLVPEW